MKKLIGVIWVVFGVGLFLYSLSAIKAETEMVTHALTLGFGVTSVLAGWLSLREHKASRGILWIISILITIYSIFAFSMVGWEFGVGFVARITLLIGFAAITIFSLLKKWV